MYTIKEAAEKEGLSTYALRFYHDKGLLPAVQRDANNNRVFTEKDLISIHFVKCLRNSGMPLKQIKHYMTLVVDGDKTIAERLELLKETREFVLDQQKKIAEELKTLERKITNYEHALFSNGDTSCK